MAFFEPTSLISFTLEADFEHRVPSHNLSELNRAQTGRAVLERVRRQREGADEDRKKEVQKPQNMNMDKPEEEENKDDKVHEEEGKADAKSAQPKKLGLPIFTLVEQDSGSSQQ